MTPDEQVQRLMGLADSLTGAAILAAALKDKVLAAEYGWKCKEYRSALETALRAALSEAIATERQAIIDAMPGGDAVDPQWVCDVIRARGAA